MYGAIENETALFIVFACSPRVFSILVQDGSVPAVTSEKTVAPVVVPESVKNIEVKKEVPAPVKQEMKEIEKPKAVVVEEDEQDDDDFVVVDNEEEDM